MHRLRRQGVLLSLLLAALLLRGLLPLGYMPKVDAGQGLSLGLVFCTAQGIQQRFVTDDQAPASEAHEDCPYGFALSMGFVPAAAAPQAVPADLAAAPLPAGSASLIVFSSAPFSARGPPQLV